MNWLDQTITWLSPKAGFRRAQYRAAADALLAYEGARQGRRTAGWVTPSSSADAEIGSGVKRLRDRSRDLVRNNPYAARAINEMAVKTIGTGIQAQAATANEQFNQKLDAAWRRWMEECDTTGKQDFHGLQDLATRIMLESGEVLIRKRVRRDDDNLFLPLQLQVMEPDYLDLDKTESLPNGGRIIHGVEYDAIDRILAYWLFEDHPGNSYALRSFSTLRSRRIEAANIIHCFRKQRSQTRGVPLLAPVIVALRDLDEYQDAERVRKKIEACLSLFIEPPEGQDTLGVGADGGTEDGKQIEEFRPGMIIRGRAGEKAEFFAPTPAGGYMDYVRQNERVVASGIGLPYELLTGDLSNVNYSSYKAGDLSFRANIDSLRWLTLIPGLLQPARRWFVDSAYMAQVIPILRDSPELYSDPTAIYQTTWTPPAFGSVDPLKDAKARQIDLELGLMTWPESVREYGFDPDRQLAQIERWKKRLEAAGIVFHSDRRTNGEEENRAA